jgi:dipeptidyl aminopeptidase/acylaminoacyl peptidase
VRGELDLTTLARAPMVYSLDVSPVEPKVAFNWNRSGQWELYLMALAAGAEPQQITGGPEGKTAPRWSPDGRTIAYAQDCGGDEKYDIFLYDVAAGVHRNLTPDTDETIYPDVSWSPDGRQIAFISNRAGRFAVHVMPADGSAPPRLLHEHAYSDLRVRWSPDGRWLAFDVLAQGQNIYTFIVPAGGGEARAIGGPEGAIYAANPRWSPDSRRIAFVSIRREFRNVGLYELETGRIVWVTAGEWDKELPSWSPDGRRLVYTINRDGALGLGVWEAETGEHRYLEVAPGVHDLPCWAPDGQSLVCLYAGPATPWTLWRLPLDGSPARLLTPSLPADVSPEAFTAPTAIRYPSADGASVPALLYRPRDLPPDRRPPAIVLVHGGPNWQQRNTWEPVIQVLVSKGYVVLCPNYRGSIGYGWAFQKANRLRLGEVDLMDVVAGTDHLAREGLADPARIGVTGRSWGGYLTLLCLTHAPDRWAVGSAVVPFVNWFTAYDGAERQDLLHWDIENMGHPDDVETQARCRERSPIFFMDRITEPVQLIAGENDPLCPASETEQARRKLAELGLPHECLVYPGEGHGFQQVENRIDAFRRSVAFLETHLGRP